ncbi:MAG: IS256 family transposase [Deltaproteobacteria bacterium]|nr:IS256 family transposase [Deltaproteobacteria bacterium]
MEIKISVPEAVELIKELQERPSRIFEMATMNVQKDVGDYLTNLMKAELTHILGREEYERSEGETNHRNGSYARKFCIKGIGEVDTKVPRDRKGEYQTQVLPRSKQYENRIAEDISMMYLAGISTRTLSMLSKRLIGRTLSHEEVSKANRELTDAVEKWRSRDLSGEKIKYIFVDGVIFKMRLKYSVENVAVLVAIGVTENGAKLVLGLQSGDKESATSWREFFRDLKSRGLDGSSVTLGIMDGLSGLEKVFEEEFPNSKAQRCQVHVARNVLAKVPHKIKKEVADDLRSIFYASSKKKADDFYKTFNKKWEKELPSAVKSLRQSINACLTFFKFPEEEWTSLRTTNIVERLNKEFKRRTKPMEIVAGENACYRLLAFISLKMELSWRSNPIGKVRPNLPLYQIYTK